MTTEDALANPARPGRSGSVVLLLLVAAGGIYVGMRWHTTFERLLVPGAVSVTADAGQSGTNAAAAKAAAGEKAQLWTCGMHPQVMQDHPGDCPICHMKLTPLASANAGATTGATGGVVIDPAIVQNMGLRLSEVTEGPLSQTVRVAATLRETETAQHEVNLRVSGWIQTLYANTDGMELKQGDKLFDLYSPDLRLAIEELISARKAGKPAATDPANSGMSELTASLATAAANRLLSLGLTQAQVDELSTMEHAPSVVTFLSPIDGHITDKAGVAVGASVMAGQRIYRLSQRTTMWVEAKVPEGQIASVRIGQKAKVQIDAFPGRTFEAEVLFVHPHLDDMTRTAMVRLSLPNHEHGLHEGMYATVELETGTQAPVIQVPREAVLDSGETQTVFVSLGKGRFDPRPVVTGRAGGRGMIQIISGLKPGEQVVSSGQFLIDTESRQQEAIAKFRSQQQPQQFPKVTPQPASTAATPDAAPSVPAGAQKLIVAPAAKVDAIVAAYLPLVESLGAMQTKDTPLNVDSLTAAIHGLHAEVADPEGIRIITAAAAAAEALKAQPLNNQRELFKKLSAAVIILVETMPPSPAVAGSLYVLNCPMAKADWLQKTPELANPYYADDMKECGSVLRLIGQKGAK